jgi:amino acid adenylation domain-containing protein
MKYKKKEIVRNLLSSAVHGLKSDQFQSLPETKNILYHHLINNFQKNYVFCGPKHMFGRYIEQRSWVVNSNLDIDKLKLAWANAQNKFEALKLGFDISGNDIQALNKVGRLNWKFIDLSKSFGKIEQEEEIKHICANDMAEYYDLEQGNLFRIYVIKHKANLYTCLLSSHIAILNQQIFILLKEYVEKIYKTIEKTDKAINELNFEVHQFSPAFFQEPKQTAFLDYINKIDSDCDLNGLMLNSIYNRFKPLTTDINYTEHIIQMEGDNYKKLKAFAYKNRLTLHSVLQYAWHKIINLYSNNPKTIVGTLVHAKVCSIEDINKYAGSTLNILPLIIEHQNLANNNSIIESIKLIDQAIDKIYEFGYEEFNPQIVMDSMLFFEENKEAILSNHNYYLNLTKSPIILKVTEYAGQLNINIVFNGNIYNRDRITDIACIIENLLQMIIDNPLKNEKELDFIPISLLKTALVDFNKTDENYLENITMHGLFEQQVAKNPKNIAVIYEDTRITYVELDEISNRVANYLIALGLEKGDLVGVSVYKSVNLVIALLGVIKAGGVYIPFATSYSTERLDAMLEDSNPPILIADHFIEEWSPKYKGKIIRIDSKQSPHHQEEDLSPKINVSVDDLAYVIYTSGSTGEPKGVMIEHGKVVNTLQDINFQYSVTNQDRMIAISNISFDLSVYDIFGLLAVGGTVVFPRAQKENEVPYLLDIIKRNSVTIWSSTPALMDWFISNITNQSSNYQLNSIRLVLVSGDWIPLNLPKNIKRKVPNKNLIVSALGGATEVSIWSVHYPISKIDLKWRSVPYGKPLGNQTVYILDNNLKPVPVGAVGEMYIGGKGLAKGYYKQPLLTSDKFKYIKLNYMSPGREHELRVYKTEDLGRYMEDGNIEFLGRYKSQIILNGLIVWPGVVETLISQYSGIKQSIVLGKGEKDKHLVCYYVADSQLNKSLIIAFLSSYLPNYLIPREFIKIDSVPLSRNGKLDRGALSNYTN